MTAREDDLGKLPRAIERKSQRGPASCRVRGARPGHGGEGRVETVHMQENEIDQSLAVQPEKDRFRQEGELDARKKASSDKGTFQE